MYNIKRKLINGKVYYGIMDDDLEQKAEFKYQNIITFKKENEMNTYYLCEKIDGYDLFFIDEGQYSDHEFYLVATEKTGYTIEKYIGNCDFICKKQGEIGIVNFDIIWDRNTNKYIPFVKVSYDFGKADQIKSFYDGALNYLYHYTEQGVLQGLYNDVSFGTVEPEYNNLEMIKRNSKIVPLKHTRGNRKYSLYRVDVASDIKNAKRVNRVCNSVALLEVGKCIDGKIVKGLLQAKYDVENCKFNTEKFLSLRYKDYKDDQENQIIYLTEEVDGEEKKGLIGYAIHWDMNGTIGGCSYLKEIEFPCKWDDLRIVLGEYNLEKHYVYSDEKFVNFIIGTDHGKEQLFEVNFRKICGDEDITDNQKSWYKIDPAGNINNIGKCVYDRIYSVDVEKGIFYGKRGNEIDILTSMKDKDGNYITIEGIKNFSVAKDGCKTTSVTHFIVTLNNGNQKHIHIHRSQNYWDNTFETKEGKAYKQIECIKEQEYSEGFIGTNLDDSKEIFLQDDKVVLKNIDEVQNFSLGYKMLLNNKKEQAIYDYDYKQIFGPISSSINVTGIGGYYNTKAIFVLENKEKTTIQAIKNNEGTEIDDQVEDAIQYESFIQELEENTYNYVNVYNINNLRSIWSIGIINQDGSTTDKLFTIDKGIITPLLEGNFHVEKLLDYGRKTLLSIPDSKENKTKYGVIENKNGNICIPFDCDSVAFDEAKEEFVVTLGEEKYRLDKDGCLVDDFNSKVHSKKNN